MLRFYLRMLEKRPTVTMACSTGTLMAMGDAISQTLIEKRHKTKTFQPERSLRFLGFGFFFAGPTIRLWYVTLERIIPVAAALRPLKMMLADQVLFAPFFLTVFWTTMGALRGETIAEIKSSYRENFFPVMISNYKLWPAAQMINFYLVPLQHRVMFVNVVALGWNTYLAWRAENQLSSKQSLFDENKSQS